jgi:hypothetical protein
MTTGSVAIARAILGVATLLAMAGCATHSEARRSLVEDVRRGYYQNAEARVEELAEDASEKDSIMSMMDRGMVAHLQGRYTQSNQLLDAAKRKLDQLFGVQISDELEAIAWNESSKSFKGEEFERVMLYLLMAFNYLHLGSLEDAAVEARQINQRLQVYCDILKKANLTPHYTQDPFAQYLAGLVAEANGDTNDAFRSYEDALQGYAQHAIGVSAPSALKAALYRTARVLGYNEAVRKYVNFANLPDADPDEWQSRAHLVVIVGVGQVAHKEARSWTTADGQGDIINIPYPVFVRGPRHTTDVRVEAAGAPARLDVVQDVSTLAINVLDDKNGQIKGKAVAKALARYLAKKAARAVAASTNNQAVGLTALLTNATLNVADIAETADTRSWMTLPDHYRMALTSVDPEAGQILVRMRAFGTEGVIDQQIFSLRVRAGQTRFVVLRVREAGGALASAPSLPKDAVRFASLPVLPALPVARRLPPVPRVSDPDPFSLPPSTPAQAQSDASRPPVTTEPHTPAEPSTPAQAQSDASRPPVTTDPFSLPPSTPAKAQNDASRPPVTTEPPTPAEPSTLAQPPTLAEPPTPAEHPVADDTHSRVEDVFERADPIRAGSETLPSASSTPTDRKEEEWILH